MNEKEVKREHYGEWELYLKDIYIAKILLHVKCLYVYEIRLTMKDIFKWKVSEMWSEKW